MNEPNGRYESTSNESSDGSHSSGEANIPSKNCPLNGHISANVVSSEIFDGDGKKFTVYKMSVSCGGHRWQVDRRYNEFRELVSNLKRIYPTFVLKLPGKKLFGNNFKSDFIRSRRQGLDEFVQGLCSDPQLCSEPEVQAFFKVSIKGSGNTDGSDGDEEPMVIDSAWSDGAVSGNEKGEERAVNLGPTEKIHMKPSDFEFLKVIGKGSFGKVMLARHRTENKTYAVKVLQKKMIIKRNEKTHIMCERNVLLKNLNHPFLVGLHYSFQTRDKLYFVLDYLNGGEVCLSNLFFHLQRETYFAEPRARFYAAEITSALGYLHSHGIVYRDLKPENLLLDSEG
ncbi:Serine/threonine-protein kinase Sgk3-like protein, partial [Leptotrombidium deliense]